MCLNCDLREQHGGRQIGRVVIVEVWLFKQPIILGYLQRWQADNDTTVWWTACHGVDGTETVPITTTTKAQAYRSVSGKTVPLFASKRDAEYALRSAFGKAVVDA